MLIPLTGCFESFNIYSKKEIHRTVDYLGNGKYIVDYPAVQIFDKYGNDARVAVPIYLKNRNLIPQKCTEEINVVLSGRIQNGDGWAEFTCGPAEQKDK